MKAEDLRDDLSAGNSDRPPSTSDDAERAIVEGMNKLRDQMVAAHRAGREVSVDVERLMLYGEGTRVYQYTITLPRDDEA